YEMLSGRKPFTGDDISETLVSVLRDEPDWNALPPQVPPSVRQALHVCLQKDPKRRVRDMSAIRLAMEGAFESPVLAVAVPAAAQVRWRRWRQVLPWAAAAFLIGV